MKHLFITLAIGFSAMATAQRATHEVKWNVVNTIALASVEVGYEYFLDDSQSVGVELHINDVFNWSVNRQAKDFDTNSIVGSYNFYTGQNASGVVISPQMKARFGSYQKTEGSPKIDMDSFMLGIGLGYKWNFHDKFTFGPHGFVGRNFSDDIRDEFDTPVEFGLGFSVGYRF